MTTRADVALYQAKYTGGSSVHCISAITSGVDATLVDVADGGLMPGLVRHHQVSEGQSASVAIFRLFSA